MGTIEGIHEDESCLSAGTRNSEAIMLQCNMMQRGVRLGNGGFLSAELGLRRIRELPQVYFALRGMHKKK